MFSGKNTQWRAYALAFALGIACVLAAKGLWSLAASCDARFDLLHPDAACRDGRKGVDEWDYDPLRQKLAETIEGYATAGTVPHVALFFRNLKNGPRVSIREDETFAPASLLKLPIMMVILHQADAHPAFLDERITYDKPYAEEKEYVLGGEEESIQLHSTHTVRELLEKMILFSDNTSSYLLLDRINALGLRENSNTFADLGTQQLLLTGQLDNTRLISLVNIFATLYNGSYLSPRSSQYALELLTRTNFRDGLVAGVPEGVRVAHKFGIRGGPAGESELHDCGIVYHPTDPYVLCVLTAGADTATASAAIGDLSAIVYGYVDALGR